MKPKLMAAILGFALLAVAARGAAGEKVRCEILTIEASNGGQGIDPALLAHASILRKSPFVGFDTFRLVQRQSYELTLGVPSAVTLPSPLRGALTFNNLLDGRLDITLSIERPSGGPVLVNGKATPGSPFFAAGLKSEKGRWIFGIICDKGNGVVQY